MATVINPAGACTAAFRRLAARVAATQPDWVTRRRQRAIDTFERLGFPTTRDEEWRFTNVTPIAETEFVPAGDALAAGNPPAVESFRLPMATAELVFVNGRYASALSKVGSLPPGARVESLASALTSHASELEQHLAHVAEFERQAFVALNTALWTDGVFVSVPAGTVLQSPVHIMFVSTGIRQQKSDTAGGCAAITHPRVLVLAGRDSQFSIVESYLGASDGRYFTNAVTEIVLGDQALVEHYKLQAERDISYHMATIRAVAASNATFRSHSIGFGGALVRNDVVATLSGEGAECTLNGLDFADGTRLVDNHTMIDHTKPHCSSRELYKVILADRARAVFNGKIVVRPDAQKTDAKQTNKALLLSEDAQINTKPQLEIFANDVKCTHGAAVGQMDEDALFYLRARGLALRDAREFLIHAFAGEVLNKMPLEALRDRADAELLRQLTRSGAGR